MTKFLLIFALGLIPIFLWGGYFYYKDPRKPSLGGILTVFALGTLSILPVIFFHQWLLGTILPDIKEWWPIFNLNFLSALMELALMFLFTVFFVTVFALFHFLFTLFFCRSAQNKSHKKLYHLVPILLFFLLFLFIEGFTNLTLQQSFLLSLTGSTIFFAVVEEYFKYAINPFLAQQKINSVGTAMAYALYVGLAFAFVENLLFFYVTYNSPDFQRLVIYRSLATTLLHVGASGVFGYFYGLSLFSGSIVASYEIERGQYRLPFGLHKIFKKQTSFESFSVTQGFFLAAFFHSLFNVFLHLNMKNFAIGVVITLTLLVVFMLRSKASQVQYGLIGTDTMPQIDFEKLRLQIAFLKEMQGLQKANPAVA